MFASPLDEAKTLIMRGAFDPAIQRLSEFLNGEFYHEEALFMLGACLQAKGMNGLSAVVTSAAIDARASKGRTFPEALMNLGAAYKAEHKNDVAEKVWLDALKHETLLKERSKILCNLAGLYTHEGSPARAIEYCNQALKEDPNNHGAHANRGMASLELGRWADGWAGWAHTYATGDRQRRTYGEIPEWDGSPDKTVIVWGDQGIGDELFYASCFKDMQRVCRKVILDCHPRLPALFQRSFPEIEVHGTRKDLTDLRWVPECGAEASIAMADLFGFFRNTDESWGDGAAYLKASGAVSRHEIRRGDGSPYIKAAAQPRMRIGLSWTGGSKRTRTDLRSLPVDALVPILRARPDAAWFSLQYTPNAAREVCELEERTGIRISHYPGMVECYDYDHTAAFVASLDLVITVPTTVHHLACALGVPTWTLVQSRPSWRYGITGTTRPWYASARLFRQEVDGDWSHPVRAVAEALSGVCQREQVAA